MTEPTRRERAFAKVNLVLHLGPRRLDGLHELCSLFASIELADEVSVGPASGSEDTVVCPGVDGPNLAAAALAAFRSATGAALPPLEVRIDKRIPVAAGLGGGSADAAAVLRAANRLAGEPLGPSELRSLGHELGSDVPSQIDPRHALVTGAGELIEPVRLRGLPLVLALPRRGLSTAEVYAEADRLGVGRQRLDPAPVRRLAAASAEGLAQALENDLEPAALSLRPELESTLEAMRAAGARGAAVAGSGPTVFGVFRDGAEATAAAKRLPGAVATTVRSAP